MSAHVTCPDENAHEKHAFAKAFMVAKGATCDLVRHEIVWRIEMANRQKWHDPSNMYSNAVQTYAVLCAMPDGYLVKVGRTTPRFKFHDLINFVLIRDGNSSDCLISACSVSQGMSIIDFGTNYCNIFNLICGSEFGCHPTDRSRDFHLEEDAAFSSCGWRDWMPCLKWIDKPPARDPSENKGKLKNLIRAYSRWFPGFWENAEKPLTSGEIADKPTWQGIDAATQ